MKSKNVMKFIYLLTALTAITGCGALKDALDEDDDEDKCFTGDTEIPCDQEKVTGSI